MVCLLMILDHFIIERSSWIGADWASPLLILQFSKWCCSHWSFLLKCEKESNSLPYSYVRESMWPRQVLLFQQGYFKQDFFKQGLSQETAICHSSSLAYILPYIPAAPLKVKWSNTNSTTIPQILFLFCGLEKVFRKKLLSTHPGIINAHWTLDLCHMKILAMMATQIVKRENSFPLMLR